MCKQNQNQQQQATPAQGQPQTQPQGEQQTMPAEVAKAQFDLQQMQIRANAEFNASPAGQMMRQFETYQRIAAPLSQADFVPQAYKNNLPNCVIAVEIAARMNIFPLTVMQNLCIVNGNPKWMSKFLIGCVNTCGRYTTLGYHFEIDGQVGDVLYKTWERGNDGRNHEVQKAFEYPMLDNLTCVAYATEKATGQMLQSSAVSVRMAIQEGWYTKPGSKWPTMTEQMLRYRAASFWVSAYAPEMAMGFGTAEEARDIVDVEYEDVTETTNQKPRSTRPANMETAKEKLRERESKKNAETAKTQMP